MKITAKCYYAIIASSELAQQYGLGPLKGAVIAEKYGIPTRFLELTLNELKNTGVVESRRGADGGYYLKQSPDTITVHDIVKAIDGDVAVVECDKHGTDGRCLLEGYMRGLRDVIVRYLQGKTLREVAAMLGGDERIINYSI